MPYRVIEEPCLAPPKRDMTVAATGAEFRLTNGTINYLAIPCFYVEVLPPREAIPHCRDWHDHIGWPSPANPDHICQASDFADSCCDPHHVYGVQHHGVRCAGDASPYLDMQRVFPIRFIDEGYDRCSIILHDGCPAGLSAEATFDEEDQWIIRIAAEVNMPSAQVTTKSVPFSIFAAGDFDGRPISQIVQHGRFLILPAII